MSVGDLTFLESQVLLSYKIGVVELLVFWSIWILCDYTVYCVHRSVGYQLIFAFRKFPPNFEKQDIDFKGRKVKLC